MLLSAYELHTESNGDPYRASVALPHRCCDKRNLGNDKDDMDRITDEVSHLFTLQPE